MPFKKLWYKIFNSENYKALKNSENIQRSFSEYKKKVEPYLEKIEKKNKFQGTNYFFTFRTCGRCC